MKQTHDDDKERKQQAKAMAKVKRSNLSVAERCLQDVSGSLESEEMEKDKLMQKLNEALM